MADNRAVYLFIYEAGTKLEARATTCATAAILNCRVVKRLQINHGLCPYTLAAACLYLSGKSQEDFLKIRDVTNVAYKVLHPTAPELDVNEQYWDLRESIGRMEHVILRCMAFKIDIDARLAHAHLVHYLDSLSDWLLADVLQNTPVRQAAWTLLKDTYLCPQLAESHSQDLLAVCCLNLALHMYGVEVPLTSSRTEQSTSHNHTSQHPWWKVFNPKLTTAKVNSLTKAILTEIYDEDDLKAAAGD